LPFSPKNNEWVYRISDRRTISVKAKNDQVRKIAAIDLVTNLPFAIEVPSNIPLDSIDLEKAIYASLKVYTSQNIKGVPPEYIEFFKVLDVDQTIADFIKVYWLFPKLIRFELIEMEPV
jgi:hypothetical protein